MWRKTDDIAARYVRLAHSLADAARDRDAQIVGAMHRVYYANCVMPTRKNVVQKSQSRCKGDAATKSIHFDSKPVHSTTF
jgi:hypothetical protein